MSPRLLGSGMPRAITTGKWVKQAKYKTWVNQAAKMKNFLNFHVCAIFYVFFFLTMGRTVVELQSCVMHFQHVSAIKWSGENQAAGLQA